MTPARAKLRKIDFNWVLMIPNYPNLYFIRWEHAMAWFDDWRTNIQRLRRCK